jgi:hypothetical protein
MHQLTKLLYLFEQFTHCWTNLHSPVYLLCGECNLRFINCIDIDALYISRPLGHHNLAMLIVTFLILSYFLGFVFDMDTLFIYGH